MGFAKKVAHRLTDPVFYRKHFRNLMRRPGQFSDEPLVISQDDLRAIKKVLVFVAHPDDETFSSGLLLAMKANGTHVTLICLTRGEGGPTGGAKREELGKIRENEMRGACDALGVDDLVFLDHIDPMGSAYRVYAPDVSPGKLAEEISVYAADVDLVISHGSSGEYWHAAHLLVHAAVGKVIHSLLSVPPAWVTFLARDVEYLMPHLVNHDDEAIFRFDGSAYHLQRLKALNSHQSQMSLFRRFAGGTSDDFVQSTSLESYCVQSGSVPGITDRESD